MATMYRRLRKERKGLTSELASDSVPVVQFRQRGLLVSTISVMITPVAIRGWEEGRKSEEKGKRCLKRKIKQGKAMRPKCFELSPPGTAHFLSLGTPITVWSHT